MAGLRCLAIRVLVTGLAPFAAIAADEPPGAKPAPALVDEIIVTATRRGTTLTDVPFNIAALSGDALDRYRAVDLNDLARLVPGLVVVDQGRRAASRTPVRGLNVASLNESAVLFNSGGGTLQTYVGDVPVFVDLRMRDVERVEILLGPQGTMYGAGTLGGAVRYIPNRPDASAWKGTVSASGFAWSESDGLGSDVWGIVNVPLIADRLALRVSAYRYDDPGFIDYPYILQEPGVSNPNPDFDDPAQVAANLRRLTDADAGDIEGGRASLLWVVSDSLSVTAAYHLQETDFGGRTVNHRQALDTGRYEAAHRIEEPNRRRNEIASLDISADLGFAQLVSVTAATRYGDIGQRDGTDLLLGFGIGVDFPQFVVVANDRTDEERFNQEVRLVSNGDSAWDWIAGAFFNRYEFSHAFSELGPGYAEFLGIDRPDNLLSVIRLEEELEEFALFGELGRRLTERWRVSIGARRFDSSRQSGNATDFPLFNTLDGLAGPTDVSLVLQSFDFDDDGTLFNLNSSVDLDEDLVAYLTVSEGYRLGGVNPFAPCPAPIGCLRSDEVLYLPDSTTNYELGLKGALLDGAFRFSAAAYYIDWQDIQLETVSEDLFFITVNGGDARSRGIELSADMRISDRLRASIGYAFNRAELSSFTAGLVDGVADGFPGDRLPGTPEHQGALRLDYVVPVGGSWDLEFGYGFAATGDVVTKVGRRNGGEALPGYAMHNIVATLSARDGWSLRFFIDNLFDEFAETNTRTDPSFIRSAGLHPLRSYFRNVATPRAYGLEVRLDFGAR